MAGFTGAAAYQRLERLDNQISDNANKAADRAAANMRQQKALNAQQKEADQKRQDELFDKNKTTADKFKIDPTTHNDADTVSSQVGNDAYKAALDAQVEANELYRTGDVKGYEEKMAEVRQIEHQFNNYQESLEGLRTSMEAYNEMLKSGNVVDEELASAIQSLSTGKFKGGYVRGEGIKTSVAMLDKNGEQKIDPETGEPMYKVYNMADLQKELMNPFTVSEMYDKDSEINTFASNLGTKTWDEESKDYIYTKQEWDDVREVSAQNFLDGITGDVDENGEYTDVPNKRKMYDYLYQLTGIEKKDGFTKEEKDFVRDRLYGEIRGQYTEESSSTIKGLTAEQKLRENAANRAVTMRGQDIGKQKADADDALAAERLKLDWWKAMNPNKSGKGTKKEIDRASVVRLYDIAKQIGNLGAKANDDQVQQVLDDNGLGFVLNTDWQLWFQENEFDLGKVKDIKNKDAFKIVKGLAAKAGLELEDTDIREVLLNPEKYRNGGSSTPTTTTVGQGGAAKFNKKK